jgi:diguanylate cyclase (GGDEF)-like protein
LLIIPLGTLFVAYRAYLSEQERQKQLEFVHEAGRTLSGTGEIAWLLETMLERSLHAFRAEAAEVILFGRGEEPARRTARGPGERHEVMAPLDPALAEAARRLVDGSPGARVLGQELADSGLVARGVTLGMIAPLRGEEDLLGAILLAGRLGVASPFDRDDLMLLDTLAANASVALQHDRLEHAASHDSLTGLLSRAAFNDHVAAALAAEPLAVALLFVDLDNFKTVNDTLGHARGDDVLVTVGERLRACVRGDDVVARLGGDEFAILVRAPDLVETAAISVAERIIASCRIEVSGESVSVIVHASVGVAVCRHEGATGEELINAADLAMYEAKTGGRGRYVVFGGEDTSLAA